MAIVTPGRRRAIAWKPSARRGALLVRAYEQPQGADVVLDWATLGLAHEHRICRLARWVDDADSAADDVSQFLGWTVRRPPGA